MFVEQRVINKINPIKCFDYKARQIYNISKVIFFDGFKFIFLEQVHFPLSSTFMTSPMIRKLSLKIQREMKTGPMRNTKVLNHIKHMSSIINRSFIAKQNKQYPEPSIKESKILAILNQSPFKNNGKRRLKTQQSNYVQLQKQVYTRRQNSATNKSQRKKDIRKTLLQQQQTSNTQMFVKNSKGRSLPFQCYYKNIRQAQNKQKRQNNEQSSEKGIIHQPVKHFTNNLNHQMHESMKRHIRKGMKVIQVGEKFITEPVLYYGLDIKGIQARLKPKSPQSLPKGFKKYSASSFLVVKKSCSKKNIQSLDSQAMIIKKKQSTIFVNLIGKKKSVHSKSSKGRYNQYQNQQQKTIFTRIQGMTKNLQMILLSFNCYLPQECYGNFVIKQRVSIGRQLRNQVEPKQKKREKYSYFVGYGNNRNLIRSLMKKRWWWMETQYINQADFIWTQLKVAHILDELEIIQHQKQKVKVEQQDKFTEEIIFDTHSTMLQTISKSEIGFSKSAIIKQGSSSESIDASMQSYKKLLKIFHKHTPTQHLSDMNFSSISKNTDLKCLQIPKKVHNHYRLNYMFGNKNALFHNLKMYFQFLERQDELNSIIPKTYYLEKMNKAEINRFYQKQFASNNQQNNSGNSIWIVKPAQNSNRGQGISVHTTFQSIKKQICSSKSNGKFIVQSYMRNLFLYQKRKFDIRTYMLMLTINSTTKFFWYNQGYLRTSSQYYDLSDIDNVFVHLTNDAIQCDSQNYGRFEPGNKLSYSQFQRYLETNYQKQKLMVDGLNGRMKSIAAKAVEAIYPKVKTENVQYSFQLFGLDFLIDRDFRPWLVQINTNPCLQLGCPVLQRLIPRMLQNMLRLSLDPVFQPSQQVTKTSSYFIYDNFFDINRFQLIFDSKYNSQQDWLLYCRNLQEKVYADDDQVFENDGEQVEVEI